MTRPPLREVVILQIDLQTEKAQNGIGERQPGGDGAQHRHKCCETKAQEEQPHTPTRNRFGQRNFHFTLSYKIVGAGRIASYL